jgi:serine/threonine-protein phosphatase PGAM5
MFRASIFAASLGGGWLSGALFSSSSSSSSSSSTAACSSFFTTSSDRHSGEGDAGGGMDDQSCPVDFDTIRTGRVWGQKWCNNWDGKAKNGASSAVKAQYILVRHGQYQNESNARAGDSERTLTPLGVRQAKETGAYLARAVLSGKSELFVNDHFDAVYSSDMTRAIQTCEHITDAILHGTGEDDGSPRQADIKQRWVVAPELAERFPCDPQPAYPKHARRECHDVVEGAFKKHIRRPAPGSDRPQLTLIVCHANVIRYFVCRALQLPPEAWLRISHGHLGLTTLTVRGNGNVSIGMLGSTTHLPAELQTLHNK